MLVVLAVLACSCSGPARIENIPLQAGEANPERRSLEPLAPDRPVILMAFSGGGSRATALAAAVLKELSETKYVSADGPHPLTADVKLLSSASGGSVAAAWFALNRDAAHPDGDLLDLRTRFLAPDQDNMKELELDAVNPVTWLRLVFTNFTRIEALEDLFKRKLFGARRFAELNQPGRPLLILNTTDMAGGESFGLIPRRFDDLCSNHDALPIATGVAASAAFPVLLSPVSFADYSPDASRCPGQLRNGTWFVNDLTHPTARLDNLPEYRDARYTNDLRHGENPFRDIRYLNFLDGGLADNLGVGAIRTALIAPYDDARILKAVNDGRIRNLVIIVVNARSDPPSPLYQRNTTPGLIDSITTVIGVPIDSNTANAQLALNDLLDEIAAAVAVRSNAKFHGMNIYGVTVDFDQLPAETAGDRALRDLVKNIPTSWTLTGPQLDGIDRAAKVLLSQSPCYARLAQALSARPAPPMPSVPCATLKSIAPQPAPVKAAAR